MQVEDVKTAARVIRAGGVVAYPTESCYGLGCDPRRHEAVRRLLHIKRRRWEQGLILIAARTQQLLRYVDCSPQLLRRIAQTWPGPYTWLMPPRPMVSRWLTGVNDGIAVRVTAHKGAATLCNTVRLALTSTSANRHGRPPARSAQAVHREFGNDVDYVLVGNIGNRRAPSEIRDALSGKLIRAG